MRTYARIVGTASALLLLAANMAVAAAPAEKPKSYLVSIKPGHSARGLRSAGVNLKTEWAELGAAHVEATSAGLAALRGHAGVNFVEEDREVHAFALATPLTDGAHTWGLQAVRAPEAWALGSTGQGIKVCILDTGIDYNHPEFVRNGASIIKASKNFVADGHPDATDGNHHGTHVAGTIAGQTNASGSLIGVAPGVDLYIARVLGDNGSGTTSGVINGLNWCVSQGVQIASLSLGSSASSRTEQKAFDNANTKGVLSIAASGNAGATTISYPANYASVVAVGAVDSKLNIASFSNTGKDQELVGPGVSVLSSLPRGTGLKGDLTEAGVPYRNNPLEFANAGSASGPLVECGIADTTTSCVGMPATGAWIAMINRGTIAFADKVKNVSAQGAAAAIIANNDTANPDDSGSFTLGAAGAWIPTVSVSYNSGAAIRSGGLSTGSVAIGPWDYAYFDGTSMATPHASAVAALAWSAKPTLTNAKIRTVLQQSALDLGAAGRDNTYGYGLVQADKAVSKAKVTN